MSSRYKPQNSNSVDLIFKDLLESSTDLIFLPEIQPLDLDAIIDVGVQAIIVAERALLLDVDAIISTDIQASIQAIPVVFLELNAVIDTQLSFHSQAFDASNLIDIDVIIDLNVGINIPATLNINNERGVHTQISSRMHQAKPKSIDFDCGFTSARQKTTTDAISFNQAVSLYQSAVITFEQTDKVITHHEIGHSLTDNLQHNLNAPWQPTQQLRLDLRAEFEQTKILSRHMYVDWKQLHRIQRNFEQSYNLGGNTELHFNVHYQDGLDITTSTDIPWGMGRPIYYRKHPVLPWPTPKKPQYQGSTDLNFICLCEQQNPHHIDFNFGADECLPALENRKWWRIVNEVKVSRLDNGQTINVLSGSYHCSRSTWAWAYSIKVPASEINKFAPIGNQPLILKIMVNGNEHHMLVENATRSETFGKIYYTFTGRSQTALLSVDYAPTRSFLQENERTSVQLVLAELDRVNSATQLDWQLIDALGWIVESESLSYTNLSPIDAIKLIAEAGGGFIYSDKANNKISIKPKYKKTYWEPVATEDYDRLLPISLVTQHDTSFETLDAYNAIDLINPNNGDIVRVKRSGTAGDAKPEVVNNALFNATSGASFGRAVLARVGKVENHTFTSPINQELNEFSPGELVAFNGQWRGIVDEVRVDFSYAKVNQVVHVERIHG